jgi:hypothetical protein
MQSVMFWSPCCARISRLSTPCRLLATCSRRFLILQLPRTTPVESPRNLLPRLPTHGTLKRAFAPPVTTGAPSLLVLQTLLLPSLVDFPCFSRTGIAASFRLHVASRMSSESCKCGCSKEVRSFSLGLGALYWGFFFFRIFSFFMHRLRLSKT